MIKTYKAIGLMSGTSLDGVDIAEISSDGVDIFALGRAQTIPYDDNLREKIRSVLGKKPDVYAEEIRAVEIELTNFHADIVNDFLGDDKVDVIGFHGHTIHHEPQSRYTHQIGDGKLLAELTKTLVVNRFRSADVCAGGQGAPLVPIYHNALCSKMEKPIVVVNIGGVANLTYLGSNGEMIALDTGPGNAPINDWVLQKAGMQMDYNGKLAISGNVNDKVLNVLMKNKYFGVYPPKSIDRNYFKDKLENLAGLSLEDGAATATAFCAESIAYSTIFYLPEMPKKMIVFGGGAQNPTLLRFIKSRLKDVEVQSGVELGFDIDAIEAQAFAYLAVRRLANLPISYPTTTGVCAPMIGGEIHHF